MKPVIITICLVLLTPAICVRGAEQLVPSPYPTIQKASSESTCWEEGCTRLVPSEYPTIQAAVNASKNGDTVIIAPGTYTGPGNRDIAVNENITIRSKDGPETCIIDCNGRMYDFHTGFLMNTGTLAGVTITRGFWPGFGGGGAINCDGGKAKLINCILTDNFGTWGGAVFCRRSNLEIFNCSLINNSTQILNSGPGGAIYCENSSIIIANCAISGNLAMKGGGICCVNNSYMTIKNSVISENSGTSPQLYEGGGGIYCNLSSMSIISSTINQNFSPHGAGIKCENANSIFISDCNISENTADDANYYWSYNPAGGGIYYKNIIPSVSGSTFVILNCSITDNVVKGTDSKGGGLYIETPISSNPSHYVNIMFTSCLISCNSAQAMPNQGFSYGGGLYCNTGQILLTETEIKDNSAKQGGGIYNAGPGINMSRCKINGNYAQQFGGAILSSTGQIILENSVFSGNQARQDYAIKFERGATLKMANCTIVGNSHPSISAYPANPPSSITNSIINENCYGFHCEPIEPRSIAVSYSDVQGGYEGIGNIDADPCFVQPGHWDTNGTPNPNDDFWIEGDYRLKDVSPCIDSGGVAFLMDNKDLAGKPRIRGVGIDMGAYEYQNMAPAANAGEDINAFAWIDGKADVTLDGSASHDADGDELSYLWTWTIRGIDFQAEGVGPTIELPIGVHRIELVVSDGIVSSQPDDVNVRVTRAVAGQLWIIPSVINRQCNHPDILAVLKLPEGITQEQIDAGFKLLLYPGGIESERQYITRSWDRRTVVMAFFDRSSFLAATSSNGDVRLDVVGRLKTGQYFFGQGTVRIINHNTNYRP